MTPDQSEALLARIPHRGPMRMIDQVLRVDGARIRTRTTLAPGFILAHEGAVSPLVSIELFAQSAAAFMAHRVAQTDQPMVHGALLGTRSLDCLVETLRVGDVLEVEAEEVFGDASGLAQFRCTLWRGDELAARGNINVVSGADVVRG